MHIFIDNKSGAPIYDQIKTQIKAQIISGELSPDEMLPSIRGLAKDLRISFITTKRAYDELEQAGYVNTVPGKGCFVADHSPQLVREAVQTQLEEHLTQAIELARRCGLSLEEIEALLRLLWSDEA